MADENKIRNLLEASQQRKLSTAVAAGNQAETLAALEQQLAATKAAYTKAYGAAVDAGWTDKELRQIGLSKPPAPPRRSPAAEPQPARGGDTPTSSG